ncbi:MULTISPECIES: hypothetical protein [unclassified Streptomyces]|uniref:hypothetical protein n=1 Tax=unclassified Streptomyces TaxID=2593676 RepID=UPI003422B635
MGTDERRGAASADGFAEVSRGLWVEEPAKRYRMPDAVRTAAVRAVIIAAVTLIQATIAFLSTLAGSWLAFPMVLSSVASTVVATWGVLDVWVTRQMWKQRNGVVSVPSSTARQLRRERRRARRAAREAARSADRGGGGIGRGARTDGAAGAPETSAVEAGPAETGAQAANAQAANAQAVGAPAAGARTVGVPATGGATPRRAPASV